MRLTKAYEINVQPQPCIRSSVLKVVIDALQAQGADVNGLLQGHGLDRGMLADPYQAVPLKNYVSLFERAAEVWNNPGLGVHVGSIIDPDDLGPVGVLYVKMRNLRDAITRFSRFFPALQSATHIAIREESDTTWLEYQILDPSIWPRRHDSEFTMALLCTLTRSQLGRNWSPEEVHFEHAAPVNQREVSQFFRTVARFEQKTNRMLIRTEDLDRSFIKAEPMVVSIIERHLIDLIGENFSYDFEEALMNAVMHCIHRGDVTLENVAAHMGMGPRTVQRRLQEMGKTFRTVVQQQRMNIAEALLHGNSISLDAVAADLAYADAATMSRAFRKWTGTTPRRFGR